MTSVDYLIPVYGQSYALGLIDSDDRPYNEEAKHPDRLLMPGAPGYVFPADRAFDSYEPLVERRRDELYGAAVSETICSECGHQIVVGLEKRGDVSSRIVMAVVGRGGRAFKTFVEGGLYFAQLTTLVERCHRVSAAQGRRLIVPAIVFLQGQAEHKTGTRHWTRLRQVLQLQEAFEDVVRSITGQSRSVPMFHTDPGNTAPPGADGWAFPDVAMAAEQAGRLSPLKHVNAGAMYAIQHTLSGKGGHPTVMGYRMLGAQIGNAISRRMAGLGHVATSVETWRMFDARTALVQLRTPDQTFAAVDWTNAIVKFKEPYGLGSGGGWTARDGESIRGGLPLTVESVLHGPEFQDSLSPDTIVLRFSREIIGAPELAYATTVTHRRHHHGRGRGVIRSSGNPMRLDNAWPVHNWLHPIVLS
ncbi:hypothetical protein [Methylopila turkensis]|uniref:Uncharacterized protein n=1 Tax=Methylopila turkensis TaxID=1437816 RepID=A0A9W6JNV9_9HYPH|nr:hypothetical protein [Methylopila turkensis]GLK79683.1 hypothetical protein GCM10008174_14240 [Methylopila turkensis]